MHDHETSSRLVNHRIKINHWKLNDGTASKRTKEIEYKAEKKERAIAHLIDRLLIHHSSVYIRDTEEEANLPKKQT